MRRDALGSAKRTPAFVHRVEEMHERKRGRRDADRLLPARRIPEIVYERVDQQRVAAKIPAGAPVAAPLRDTCHHIAER